MVKVSKKLIFHGYFPVCILKYHNFTYVKMFKFRGAALYILAPKCGRFKGAVLYILASKCGRFRATVKKVNKKCSYIYRTYKNMSTTQKDFKEEDGEIFVKCLQALILAISASDDRTLKV